MTGMPNFHSLADFGHDHTLLEGERWMIVVKSFDQTARRRRMLDALAAGPVMRISRREPATGMVAVGIFRNGRFEVESRQDFLEPRHVRCLPDGTFLVSELAALRILDSNLRTIRTITHPLFGFLHSLDLHPDGRRVLVCSTGFDAILEIEIESGEETRRWIAWDNGFNPTPGGVWLTLDERTHRRRLAEGLKSIHVQPDHSQGFGIVSEHRSAHPNAASYDPAAAGGFCVSIGFSGVIYSVDFITGAPEKRVQLGVMPHGLGPFEDGWMVTDTTTGAWRVFDRHWRPKGAVDCRELPGKALEAGQREWLQLGVPFGDHMLLLLDANRGILAADLARRKWALYEHDREYCIQDALRLSSREQAR